MPALSSAFLNTLPNRNAANSTSDALEVICAWPVSGQYGLGSRLLYYVLVAACVFARKSEWLRKACLAAALLFPAVAAIHGIVLAALHVDGAVDMDVYGAFQLCSIGILAASVTVRLSQTYSDTPGRNTIFLWTALILAGLLSLTIEFYRIKTSPCKYSDSGTPISSNPRDFPYSENPTCGLICSIDKGPFSPMRGGSANNIYVIPAPNKLDFGTAMLLAAACCIPALLSLISMWNKILKTNWKSRFGDKEEEEHMNDPIEGTNGATIGTMNSVNAMIKLFLSVVEIPVFTGAVLAILCIGELNFFSHQVRYQTEPVASIGQWAPIAGTGMAALGSLYLFLAKDVADMKKGDADPSTSMHHYNSSNHILDGNPHPASSLWPLGIDSRRSRDARSPDGYIMESPSHGPIGLSLTQEVGGQFPASLQPAATRDTVIMHPSLTNDLVFTTSRPSLGSNRVDVGGRRKVAKALTAIGKQLSNVRPDLFDDSDFKRGKARDYPLIPGEEQRNIDLPQITELYNQPRDEHGNVTPVPSRSRSRARSFNSNVAANPDEEGSLTSSRTGSPLAPHSPRSPSPFPPLATSHKPQAGGTLSASAGAIDLQNPASSSPVNATGGMTKQRRDTLEVPQLAHVNHGHTRNNHGHTRNNHGHTRNNHSTSTVAKSQESRNPDREWVEHIS